MNICACGICRDDCTYHKPQPQTWQRVMKVKGFNWAGMLPAEVERVINDSFRDGQITKDQFTKAWNAWTIGEDHVSFLSSPQDWGKTPRERMDNLGKAWREGRITSEEANAIFDAPTAPMDPAAFLREPTADAYEITYGYCFNNGYSFRIKL